VLPAQFFASRRGHDQSVRRLIIAVLDDAIRTYQRYVFDRTRHGQNLFREAEDWLMAPDDASPLSFESVCAVLDLDPGYVRRWLRGWRARLSADGRRASASP
jgi:hypothetical protein